MVLSHILWSIYYGPKSDCSYYTDISKRAENKFVKSYTKFQVFQKRKN